MQSTINAKVNNKNNIAHGSCDGFGFGGYPVAQRWKIAILREYKVPKKKNAESSQRSIFLFLSFIYPSSPANAEVRCGHIE